MILHINDHLKLSDIQERFGKCFPALGIHFYTKKGTDGDLIGSDNFAGDIRSNHRNGELHIFSFNTVAQVQLEFREKFGLHVRIMRKELSGWVDTSNTDRFTLSQQMDMAAFSFNDSAPLYRQQLREYHNL